MKRIVFGLLGLFSIAISSHAQHEKLDSLYSLLSHHQNEDTLRVKILNQICFYEQIANNEKNKKYAEEALSIARKIHYVKGIGSSLRSLSQYYKANGDYERAAQYAFEMTRTLEGTTNYKGLGQSYSLLGMIYESAGEIQKAKEYTLKAIEVFKEHNITRSLGYAYDLLGYIHLKLQETTDAQKYFELALDIRLKMNDTEALIQTYAHLAIVYKRQKEYAKAIASIEKSMELQNSLKLDDKEFLAANYNNLGEIYLLMRQFNDAEPWLKKAITVAKASNNKANIIAVYETLSQLEEARGNYKQAMSFMTIRNLYKDSVFNQTKESEFARMKALYETEKKDQTIKALEQQQAVENLKQWFLLGGIFFLLIGSFVIYRLQKSHNKKTKALLEQQNILNAELQENDKLKSRFFANISHEFRTPLSLIISPIEDRLRSFKIKDDDKSLFEIIQRNSHQLLSLVNQLLDLSKLEAKKMDLILQKGDMKEFINILVASFDSLAESREIGFVKDISEIPTETWFDPRKIETIVNNLLFNAFKFTLKDGEVSFLVKHEGDTGNLTIVVRDTGVGIPEEEQKHLFTPFHQATHQNSEVPIGTGLGLSLVKELVNLYHGKISFVSSEKGTAFTVVIPTRREDLSHAKYSDSSTEVNTVNESYTVPRAIEEENDSVAKEAKDKVLIVEDNADLRNFIASTMSAYAVITSPDGEEGLKQAIENIPDLIISDVMMPRLNGIELTEKIKTDERTSHIPVILLTAKADLDSKLEGLRNGADDYLAKPFSSEELRIRVSNLIEQRKKLVNKYRIAIGGSGISVANLTSLDEKFLLKAKQIVENNIAESGFGVEQFASEMNISRTQLFRKFKALIGLSPNEFINDMRLQRAAEMISAKADTLAQISYSVGFNEQSYFSKRFKKKFGVAPSEYQGTSALSETS